MCAVEVDSIQTIDRACCLQHSSKSKPCVVAYCAFKINPADQIDRFSSESFIDTSPLFKPNFCNHQF
jgi:hypothetical protein